MAISSDSDPWSKAEVLQLLILILVAGLSGQLQLLPGGKLKSSSAQVQWPYEFPTGAEVLLKQCKSLL